MYQRDECIAEASICREKAKADPARYDDWIDQATVWLQRAIQARRGKAVSYDIRDGLMIPKRAHIDSGVTQEVPQRRTKTEADFPGTGTPERWMS
jgi:hypothetical protein